LIPLRRFSVIVTLTSPVAAQIVSIEVKYLSLGLVSETHRKDIEEHFRDFVDYLARNLSPGSEIEGRVVTAPTPFELAKLLEQRRVDFFMEGAYPDLCVQLRAWGAGKLVLRRWEGRFGRLS
jgi:hypothetical protein